MITAQDLFFTLTPATSALELVNFTTTNLSTDYQVEQPPAEVRIAGHSFVRFSYVSPVAKLHWTVLATEIRCHAVQFVVTSRDSNFPEQAAAVTDALWQWRFKPYILDGHPVEVETGIMFGRPPRATTPRTTRVATE